MDRVPTTWSDNEFKNQLIINNKSLTYPVAKEIRDFFDITPHKRYDVKLKLTWITS